MASEMLREILPLTLVPHYEGTLPPPTKPCDACHLPTRGYDRKRLCLAWGKPFETPFGYGRPDTTPSIECPKGKILKGKSGHAGLGIQRRSRHVVGGVWKLGGET